ncbi:MAG: NAD-dependent epimerase/dehydratase family protein, partial [Phascolarctobacterium sp.]
MKIIITGVHGYISNSIRRHFIEKHKFNGGLRLLDLRNDDWLEEDFSQVDTLIHCAALVHKDPNQYTLDDYVEVNANLTEKIAKKAKREGVKYFIFFSTEGVYGTTGSLFNDIVLDKDTELKPIEKYEISKKMAEDRIMALIDDNFKVAIIRPPFVYGKDCPGNYRRLREAVLKFRFIPTIKNKKSMIYIENLCEFVYQLWRRKLDGTFLPQDLPYRCTTDMCLEIAKFH